MLTTLELLNLRTNSQRSPFIMDLKGKSQSGYRVNQFAAELTERKLSINHGGFMALKYVLFDFDGTLVDSNEAVVSMLHKAAVHHRGTPFAQSELNEILGKPIREQMAYLSESAADDLVTFYRASYREVRDELTRPYDGMREVLETLKSEGLKIGIVSNKGRSGIDHGLSLLNLEDLVDVSISKDDVTMTKPHPEGIFKALEMLGASNPLTDTYVFVGDSGHDIECGKNAGCKTVLVGWTLIERTLLEPLKPDAIVETPQALLEYLESLK